jgi:predicted nucleotidyltransferase
MNPFRKELHLILENLQNLNLYKVILFGSFAYGKPDKDSDVDLIVVTKDEYFPKSYQEKSDLYLKVSNAITDIAGRIPIDLIVYTKSMYIQFIQVGSLFSKEILQNGVILYETGHEGMAEQSQ